MIFRKKNNGAKYLKRYHKSRRRKEKMDENPDILLWMAGIPAMISSIIYTAGSTVISFLFFIICVLLEYLWVKGRIF